MSKTVIFLQAANAADKHEYRLLHANGDTTPLALPWPDVEITSVSWRWPHPFGEIGYPGDAYLSVLKSWGLPITKKTKFFNKVVPEGCHEYPLWSTRVGHLELCIEVNAKRHAELTDKYGKLAEE